MVVELSVEKALKRKDLLFIDVRSPAEYNRESIPGALNIPLFNNEQQEQLGLAYHNRGEAAARRLALELAAPRLPELVDRIKTAACGKTPLLYCWRGGLRSLSLCSILNLAGIPAFQLKGGYRAFRRYVNSVLRDYRISSTVMVLNGLTGVGKTAVIQALQERGLAAINLEELAGHRGSVFGAIGLQPRSQKDFEARLLGELQKYSDSPLLIVEGEGRRIGNVYLPAFLFEAMEAGLHVLLQAPLPVRVNRILEQYLPQLTPDLVGRFREGIRSLQNRLGKNRTAALLEMLDQGDFYGVAYTLCADYYDHFYSESKPEQNRFLAVVDSTDIEQAVNKVAGMAKKYCLSTVP